MTTKAKEKWVIDAIGCQYGFEETLVPLARYLEQRTVGGINSSWAFEEYHETYDLDQPEIRFAPCIEARHEMALDRLARLHFAKLVKDKIHKEGDKFSKNLISGLDKEFGEKVACFSQEVRAHMINCVEETYSKEDSEGKA